MLCLFGGKEAFKIPLISTPAYRTCFIRIHQKPVITSCTLIELMLCIGHLEAFPLLVSLVMTSIKHRQLSGTYISDRNPKAQKKRKITAWLYISSFNKALYCFRYIHIYSAQFFCTRFPFSNAFIDAHRTTLLLCSPLTSHGCIEYIS